MSRSLAFFVLVAVCTTVVAGEQGDESGATPLPDCRQTLEPVHRPTPDYPSPKQAEPYLSQGSEYMHVFVEGTVAVEFTMSRDGTVADARIVQSNYNLVGRNASLSKYKAGYFDGFLEMNVLPAVQAWRFSPIAEPCTSHFKFTWQLEEGAKGAPPTK